MLRLARTVFPALALLTGCCSLLPGNTAESCPANANLSGSTPAGIVAALAGVPPCFKAETGYLLAMKTQTERQGRDAKQLLEKDPAKLDAAKQQYALTRNSWFAAKALLGDSVAAIPTGNETLVSAYNGEKERLAKLFKALDDAVPEQPNGNPPDAVVTLLINLGGKYLDWTQANRDKFVEMLKGLDLPEWDKV